MRRGKLLQEKVLGRVKGERPKGWGLNGVTFSRMGEIKGTMVSTSEETAIGGDVTL